MKIIYTRGDLVGDVIFLEEVKSNTKHRKCLFQCRCGNEFICRLDSVKSNDTSSCGCLFKNKIITEEQRLINKKKNKAFWDSKNKEYKALYLKNWKINNKDIVKEQSRLGSAKYYKTEKGKIVARRNAKLARDKYPYKVKIRSLLKSLLKRIGLTKKGKTEILLGYTYKNFEDKFPNIKINQHIDHIIPISWFIPIVPIHIINSLSNLQLLDSDINIKKKNYYADIISPEFYTQVVEWIKPEYISKLKVFDFLREKEVNIE